MNWMSEIFLSTLVNALTDRMPTTEDTVRSKTIVCASGHRNEMAAKGVITTVLDLQVKYELQGAMQMENDNSHYDTSCLNCVLGIRVSTVGV